LIIPIASLGWILLKTYADLIKFGIVVFVLATGTAGYLLAQDHNAPLRAGHFALFLLATFCFSAGSFALNQYQEKDIDKLMPRTQGRPIPAGILGATSVLIIACALLAFGIVLGWLFVSQWFTYMAVLTAVLYNGAYTMFWKKFWTFGAVPGAIPGAMPVVLGFAAHDMHFTIPCLYLFVLMFLWQMPHFWALALKYKDDYALANIPVLPAVVGEHTTLYHMGLYVFAYAAWAVVSPWFISVWVAYLIVIIPFSAKVVWEFLKFQQDTGSKQWTSFFLWTTFSVIVFVMIPVVDKWSELMFSRL
jgi:heme o synthase